MISPRPRPGFECRVFVLRPTLTPAAANDESKTIHQYPDTTSGRQDVSVGSVLGARSPIVLEKVRPCTTPVMGRCPNVGYDWSYRPSGPVVRSKGVMSRPIGLRRWSSEGCEACDTKQPDCTCFFSEEPLFTNKEFTLRQQVKPFLQRSWKAR